jgi:hypothetical protein
MYKLDNNHLQSLFTMDKTHGCDWLNLWLCSGSMCFLFLFLFFFFFFLVVLLFALRVLHLPGRHSTTWTMPLALFALFSRQGLTFSQDWSHSLDYRCGHCIQILCFLFICFHSCVHSLLLFGSGVGLNVMLVLFLIISYSKDLTLKCIFSYNISLLLATSLPICYLHSQCKCWEWSALLIH